MTNSASDINVPANFQPMLKRFMVWDKGLCKFLEHAGEKVYDLPLLTDLLDTYNVVEIHEDLVIVQSTNLFDEDNEEIFEGSILKSAQNKIGIVKCLVDEGRYIIYYPNCGWTALDVLSAGDNNNIGHILANPELLEEK